MMTTTTTTMTTTTLEQNKVWQTMEPQRPTAKSMHRCLSMVSLSSSRCDSWIRSLDNGIKTLKQDRRQYIKVPTPGISAGYKGADEKGFISIDSGGLCSWQALHPIIFAG